MARVRPNSGASEEAKRSVQYRKLFRKFVLLTLVCSILPLLLIGWVFYSHYSSFAEHRVEASLKIQLEQHRELVDLFLQEQASKLNILAQVNSREFLTDRGNLSRAHESLNKEIGVFTDLGVIDASGRHLAYIGPYDLLSKNYSQTFWFQDIINAENKAVYISDMFLGYRNVPHFIIAVLRRDRDDKWILRATIDTDVFRGIVEDLEIGSTGEAFIINGRGIFQTNPRHSGKIMEKSSFPVMPFNQGVKISVRRFSGIGDCENPPLQIAAYTWLKNPRWMLVIRQDYSDALIDVNQANFAMLVFFHSSAFIILIIAILVTRHMISVIRERDNQVDYANQKFLQASKLASIGELSSGVAHEINNPLAVILSEKQILEDLHKQAGELSPGFRDQLVRSLSRISKQVRRCKRLTHNLLRFSRRAQSVVADSDINDLIKDVVELVERDAATRGVKIFLEPEADLPLVTTDSSQLQQVFLNIVSNALDAHEGKNYGSVRICTRRNESGAGVDIVVSDTGSGIPGEIIEKIFDPFFTTKPVGRGTGLGLSICYGIVKKLGGDISVRSEPGTGTTFTVYLPQKPPSELAESIAEEDPLEEELSESKEKTG